MSRRKVESSCTAAEAADARAWNNRNMRENYAGRPGHCHSCGWPLRHPNDTNCRNCFASDTDET